MKKQLNLFNTEENFETYDDLNSFFIHCIHTCGFSKKDIAHALDLSPTGLSLRMSEVNGENMPRFTLNHLYKYILLTRDSRILEYFKHLFKKINETSEEKRKRREELLNQVFELLRQAREI